MLRVEAAVALFKDMAHLNPVIITLSGGTTHKPNPLDIHGFPITESTAAARKLVELGVPALQVLEENFSLDTVGNVSLLCHIITVSLVPRWCFTTAAFVYLAGILFAHRAH